MTAARAAGFAAGIVARAAAIAATAASVATSATAALAAIAVAAPLAAAASLAATAAVAASAAVAAPAAPAESSWPVRPLRLVVPMAAGGAADAIAVPLAAALSEQMGQPVVLDHRPGLDGDLGAEIVARSAADGYTFLLGSVEQAISAASRPAPAYDLQRDLAPVTLLALAPAVVVVEAGSSIATIAELLGNGTAAALPRSAPIDTATSDRVARLAGRQFDRLVRAPAGFAILPVPAALPGIRAGKLRPLAVTGLSRSFALPAVPTLAQAGVAGVHAQAWHALWSPAGTPAGINAALQRQVAAALDRKPIIDIWNRLGFERGGQPAQVLALTVRGEVLNWEQVIKAVDAASTAQGRAGAGLAATSPGSFGSTGSTGSGN